MVLDIGLDIWAFEVTLYVEVHDIKRNLWSVRKCREEKICREILDGLVALSIQVAVYRVYSDLGKSTVHGQDPIPYPQWIDMKRSFVRYGMSGMSSLLEGMASDEQ